MKNNKRGFFLLRQSRHKSPHAFSPFRINYNCSHAAQHCYFSCFNWLFFFIQHQKRWQKTFFCSRIFLVILDDDFLDFFNSGLAFFCRFEWMKVLIPTEESNLNKNTIVLSQNIFMGLPLNPSVKSSPRILFSGLSSRFKT